MKSLDILEMICYAGSGLLIGYGLKLGMVDEKIAVQIFMSAMGICLLMWGFRISDKLKR